VTVRAVALLAAVALPLAVPAAEPTGTAAILDAQRKQIGSATLKQVKGGVNVRVQVAGLSPGKHGIHVHAVGKCDPPDFKSAGGHFNPASKKHGAHNPEGAHAGDLPNLTVGKDGKGSGTFTAKDASLSVGAGSLFGPEGTAIVIHADPDDEKTDPAGNSGARVACGVIQKK
jgi:Cu-Zn family superoxide dismutase